jgi:O-antigen ligase
VASFFWSAFPDLTIRRAGREVIELVSVVLVISTFSHKTEPLRILFLAFLTVLFADLAAIRFGSFGGFNGIHGNKNALGAFCFFALPLFALAIFDRRIARRRLIGAFASICTVGLLLLSHSKTAIGLSGATTILIFAGWALRWTGQYKGVFAIIYFMIAAATTIVVVATGLEDTLTLLTGNPTLTGRTTLWQCLISMGRKPVFGSRLRRVVASGASARGVFAPRKCAGLEYESGSQWIFRRSGTNGNCRAPRFWLFRVVRIFDPAFR